MMYSIIIYSTIKDCFYFIFLSDEGGDIISIFGIGDNDEKPKFFIFLFIFS